MAAKAPSVVTSVYVFPNDLGNPAHRLAQQQKPAVSGWVKPEISETAAGENDSRRENPEVVTTYHF